MQISDFHGIDIIELSGQIDASNAPAIQTRVMDVAQSSPRLLLNMSAVSFMSSAGLRLLLQLHRAISGNGGQLALVGLSEELQDTMSATGFLSFFQTFPSVDAALAAFAV